MPDETVELMPDETVESMPDETVESMPDETVEAHSTSTATESTNNPTVTSTASTQPQAKLTEPETNNDKFQVDAFITMKVIYSELLKQFLNNDVWVKYEVRQKNKTKTFEKISNAICYESSKRHWARITLDFKTHNFISGYFNKFCDCVQN
ncbi:uncharacterized protein [Centruroides vittatus]|uniref:uncharacterized protein n=1 Tax=Centruroides vittatus TaxID=120091 RepID=UPI00350F2661